MVMRVRRKTLGALLVVAPLVVIFLYTYALFFTEITTQFQILKLTVYFSVTLLMVF
jgi:hypothetical protein